MKNKSTKSAKYSGYFFYREDKQRNRLMGLGPDILSLSVHFLLFFFAYLRVTSRLKIEILTLCAAPRALPVPFLKKT